MHLTGNTIIKEKINNKEIDIEYLLTGKENAKTILFVHGLGANLSQFEDQHQFFQSKYKVLSVNLRGHGNTTFLAEPTQSDFALNKLSRDIIALLDNLKIKNIHFVGNSLGGNIGYELLKSNPDRLLSFTSFGTTAELNKSDFTIGSMKLIYKLLSMKTIAKLSKSVGQTKYSKAKIYEMISQSSKQTILNLIPHLAKFNYIEIIKKNQIATLIIKGEKDKEISKVINSTISAFEETGTFKLVEMKRTGHFANLDNSKKFNHILNKFISSL